MTFDGMSAACAGCGVGTLEVGVLCGSCAAALPPCAGLVPEHVSAAPVTDRAGWLIDPWGRAHALPARATIGRRTDADVVLLTASVSRDHAELSWSGDEWQVCDLGSRNGTHLDGVRVQGRSVLHDGAQLRFGQVPVLFRDDGVAMPHVPSLHLETAAASGGARRYTIRGDQVELVLLGGGANAIERTQGGAGALLYRATDAAVWSEATLPPLEFALLEQLCNSAVAQADSVAPTRGILATKHLARTLPFQSRYANEENVRQVVRRLRSSLGKLGANELVASIPGRGYYLDWSVALA